MDSEGGLSININNPDFTDSALTGQGQETTGGSFPVVGGGSYPTGNNWVGTSGSGIINESTALSGIPGGPNVGYVVNGNTLYQNLTVTLVAGATYHLTADIANIGGGTWNGFAGGAMALNAGGTQLASVSIESLNSSSYESISVQYTAPLTGVPSGDLAIILSANGNATAGFTDFSLTAVPEPIGEALGMFGGLAVLWWSLGLCWTRTTDKNEEPEELDTKKR
jgi:hypothetical protein